ncbi:MAG: FRG domain-containing protein [bacterium]|nr:FRG domain-containing protein [bacterium]
MMMSHAGFPLVARSFDDLLDIVRWLRDDLEANSSDSESAFTWRVGRHRFPYGIWFRGEHEVRGQRPLTPGIFRKTNDDDDLAEAFINNHLQTRIPELAAVHNPFDRLCMAQHYNVPTRLLDWTENFLTAAYFAVAGENDNGVSVEEDGAIYVLNAYSLNGKSAIGRGSGRIHMADDFGTLLRSEMAFCSSIPEWLQRVTNRQPLFSWRIMADDVERATKFDPKKVADQIEMFRLFKEPVAVMPTRANPRMLTQASTFTIHGSCNWADSPDDTKFNELNLCLTPVRKSGLC